MIAITDGDLVVGRGTGIAGPAIPPSMIELPDRHLRCSDEAEIVALDNAARDYWIDAAGIKHIVAGESWQKLRCRRDDDLIAEAGAWRIVRPADRLAEAQQQARTATIKYADAITERLTGRYPAAEVASWPTQEAEARAVITSAGADKPPLLSALAEAAQTDLLAYARIVMAKATAFRSVVAAVKAIRDEAERRIGAAADEASLTAALAELREAAEAKAAELGLAS